MNWLNVKIADLKSEAFIHSTTSQIGTWLLLCAYCASQLNSGRIRNCKNWSPAIWVRIIGTETPDTSPLWHWNRDDLIVQFYPSDQERTYINRQGSARQAALSRWSRNHPIS